jgi:sulfatase modifying factor 1
MRKVCVVVAAFMLLSLSVFATADVFNMGGTRNPDGSWTGLASLETVTVGDPGNTGELSGEGAGGYGPDRICGSVGYTYNIGKYEVTAGQYTAFLNAVAKVDTYGLYNSSMWDSDYGCKIERTGTIGNYSYRVASDRANRPVNYVSFWDACRFANWLHNGQPTGAQDLTTTEDGAYLLNGYTGYDGRWIVRKAGWRWAVTSEDEWYKAAYYKGGGTNAGYWSYPTQSDTMPSNQLVDPDPGNNATYYDYGNGYTIGSPYWRTEVGAHENSESAYGTFDQGGNVWEWNEALLLVYDEDEYAFRGLRGGSFTSIGFNLQSTNRDSIAYPDSEDYNLGFRVSQVPEPSSIVALLGGLTVLIGLRRRKA